MRFNQLFKKINTTKHMKQTIFKTSFIRIKKIKLKSTFSFKLVTTYFKLSRNVF